MSEPGTSANLEADKETLRVIMSGREYTSYHTAGREGQSWLGRAWDFIVRKLGELLPDTVIPRSAADVVSYLVILGGIALLVLLLVWIGRRIAVDRGWSGRIALTEAELSQGYADYLNKAEAAKEADLREGVRFTFLSLLFYADYRGWVQAEQWKANGEYIQELKGTKPELEPLFAEAALLFEQVYYGKRDVTADTFARSYNAVTGYIADEEVRYAAHS